MKNKKKVIKKRKPEDVFSKKKLEFFKSIGLKVKVEGNIISFGT